MAAFSAFAFAAFNWTYRYVIALQSETTGCFFMFGHPFLLEFLDHPGGLLRYAGRFLGQFYHYAWLGAVVVSACITCFGALFYGVLRKLRSPVRVSQVLYPCLFLLALHASLAILIHDTLGLVASCGAFLAYLSFRGRMSRHAYALVATPLVYGLLGAYAAFFMMWVALSEWLDRPLRSGLPFKVGYVLLCVALPFVACRWVFPIPLDSAFVYPSRWFEPLKAGAPLSASAYVDGFLAALVSVYVLVAPFLDRVFSGGRLAAPRWRAGGGRHAVVVAARLAGLAVVFHVARYEQPPDVFAARRELYNRSQWDALLERAAREPSGDPRLQFMTNFALFKKGRLLDEMFRYPQAGGALGLGSDTAGRPGGSPVAEDATMAMCNSDLFYEMGYVNLAFRHAYNHMCVFGKTYAALERMAECNIVNRNYPIAAKYLSILERTLFHAGPARRLKAVIADPGAAEREFGDLRARRPLVQAARIGLPSPVAAFQMLLESKADNRMAFDYRTAWRLLDRDEASIAEIARTIGSFKKAGYASLPIHCQEALALFERLGSSPIDFDGFRYGDAVASRVTEFLARMEREGGRGDARERLRAAYGDTYMFYFFFGVIPEDICRRRLGRGVAGRD